VRKKIARDVLEVGGDQLGGAAPSTGSGHEGAGMWCGRLHLRLQGALGAQQQLVGVVVRCPSACRRERDHARGPSTGRELQGQITAERVAHQVRAAKPRVIHHALQRFDQCGAADLDRDRRTARMPGQRGRKNIVMALQRRQHELPGAPCVHEPV
jgi:hypothetical protein